VFVQLPIQLLRLFIDPIVDIMLDVVLPWILDTFKSQTSHLQHLAETSPALLSIYNGFQALTSSLNTSNNGNNGYQVWSVTGDKSFHDIAHISWSHNTTFVMPYWEKLVNTNYEEMLIAMRSQWYRFALEDSSTDRIACILVGYGVLVTIGSWYLARSRNAYGRTVGRALQQALRQQGAILKITFFIAIELMLFPLGCGVLLDLATFQIPLWPPELRSGSRTLASGHSFIGCWVPCLCSTLLSLLHCAVKLFDPVLCGSFEIRMILNSIPSKKS
jgi:E3 ubiquitin-protein ligase DOA10